MNDSVLHLHTHFVFPFSIDQDAVMEDHPDIWTRRQNWFAHLDGWVTGHVAANCGAVVSALGSWRRSPQTHFDATSSTYQDMVFFHPFIRRVFFDTGNRTSDHDALMRAYTIDTRANGYLFYEAADIDGHSACVQVTDLRLLLFANGIGMLFISIEANDISLAHALWINEMMRKIYPSSDRQITSARIPNRLSLRIESGGDTRVLVEERFKDSRLIHFRPRISRILESLLYFADYADQEFEPVLDERMIVNTFVLLDRDHFAVDHVESSEMEVIFSRLLYVEREGDGFRYDRHFLEDQMKTSVYRRWQHEGTLYGASSYSNASMTIGRRPDLQHGSAALVHRMFASKNYLISAIALFYRATLLDFLKESALVSRQLFPVFSGETIRHRHIQLATRLMADYHYFSNYWFFSEITTKDEELEHFQLICHAYRIPQLKEEIGQQVDKLAGYIDRLYALRNNDAVNRLAMLSIILGIGALVTGFYGMNIPHLTSALANGIFSTVSIVVTSIMTLLSLALILYIVVSNWIDYRASLFPTYFRRATPRTSLRRINEMQGTVAEAIAPEMSREK